MTSIGTVKQRSHSGVWRWVAVMLTAGALGMTSCGSDGEPVYPVRGQVLYKGRPTEHAYVVFHPQGGSQEVQKIRPYGSADSEGYFSLTSRESGDGAPAGEFKVTVVWPGPARGMDPNNPDPELATAGPDRLLGRFANPETTTLRATVSSGSNNLEPFELE